MFYYHMQVFNCINVYLCVYYIVEVHKLFIVVFRLFCSISYCFNTITKMDASKAKERTILRYQILDKRKAGQLRNMTNGNIFLHVHHGF